MLRKLLPHAAIVLSGMYFVFFLIDRVNSAMSFINNRITKRLLLALCIISVVESIWLIHEERNKMRRQQAKAAEARRQKQEDARRKDDPPRRLSYTGDPHGPYNRR